MIESLKHENAPKETKEIKKIIKIPPKKNQFRRVSKQHEKNCKKLY